MAAETFVKGDWGRGFDRREKRRKECKDIFRNGYEKEGIILRIGHHGKAGDVIPDKVWQKSVEKTWKAIKNDKYCRRVRAQSARAQCTKRYTKKSENLFTIAHKNGIIIK